MKRVFKYTGIIIFMLMLSGAVYYGYPEKPLPKDKTITKLVVGKIGEYVFSVKTNDFGRIPYMSLL